MLTPDGLPREHAYSAIISRRVTDSKLEWPPLTIITNSMQPEPEVSPLEQALVQQGVDYSTTSLTESVTQGKFCIVLIGPQESVLREPQAEEFASLKRVFLESEGVLWITQGVYSGRGNPDPNLVLGLVRTIRAEQGDTKIHTLDLDTENVISPEKRSVLFTSMLKRIFETSEDGDTQLENELVERGGVLMIPRLVKDKTLNSHGSLPVPQEIESQLFHQPRRPLKAEIKTPGLLDSIYFIGDESISSNLGDGEVEVAVKASGLNFRDVMTALGQIAQYPLGIECAGIITSIGRGVRSVSVGDHVIVS